ncbi:MAG: PepSY domain-containing protein [Acinetobacter sp.]|nr:PepSY domain-containing protein [Acinetobacter sp.]
MKKILLTLATISSVSAIAIACSADASPNNNTNTQPPAVVQQAVPVAQTATTGDTTQTATTTVSTDGAINPATIVQQNLIAIDKAIALAESHSKGYAVDMELHQGQGNAIYDIEVIERTQEHRVQIDAVTGQVLSSYSERDLDLKPQPNLTLAQAIAKAQQQVQGQVVDASLDNEYIGAKYEITIISTAGHPYEIHVDAKDGTIISSRLEVGNDD